MKRTEIIRGARSFTVTFMWDGKRYSRGFHDRDYTGGRTGARSAALRWLRRKNKQLGRPESKRRVRKGSPTDAGIAAALEAYRQGETVERCAELGGMSAAAVNFHRLKAGIPGRAKWCTARQRARSLELYAGRTACAWPRDPEEDVDGPLGMSCREVGQALEAEGGGYVSQETIFRWAEAAGIIRSRSEADRLMNQKRTGIDYGWLELQAVELRRDDNLSASEISRRLGVGKSTVRRWLRKRGMNAGRRGSQTLRRWRANMPDVRDRLQKRLTVVSMRGNGSTYAAIAEKTGLSISTITKYLRDAGMVQKQDHSGVEAFGEVLSIAEWARRTGIPKATLHARIRKHSWDVEDALTRPVGS